jgi:hypothetical protein
MGVMCASYSGVAAYRAVGPYGDGPLNVRLYRAEDRQTGQRLVYRTVRTAEGASLLYFFDDATRTLVEIRMVKDGASEVRFRRGLDGTSEVTAGGRSLAWGGTLTKVGFSFRGNGVVDAWAYRDAKGVLHRIEISGQQNGKIDRWEYYAGEQLARVEEDEDRDGRVDRWQTYQEGVLVQETRDRDGDGRPDRPN